ncbi:MAG TPA: acyl-CoA dehydrogenase family protein, partial [Burkholderiales bacterium]|nr:acyl-CoA dehydrogenase family protein [Burkholderiales bacterium]
LHGLQSCIDETAAYTRERKLFGSTVLEQQWVHYKLAECQTELECLRALTHRAVDLYLGGEDVTMLASMAKLKAGRLAREIADTCLQFWGGMGYTWDNPVARAWRDGRLTSIGGGADEVMLGIICKHMHILPARGR